MSALLGPTPNRPQLTDATVAAVPALAPAAAGGAVSMSADAVVLLLAVAEMKWLRDTHDFFASAETDFPAALEILRAIGEEISKREQMQRLLRGEVLS
jgi:lipase chaperone LimK